MDQLDLTAEDIQEIILVGRRLLINQSTHPDDLRAALLERLWQGSPALAGKIQRMNKDQITTLRRTILAQRQSYA
jgi:hypothetical protein